MDDGEPEMKVHGVGRVPVPVNLPSAEPVDGSARQEPTSFADVSFPIEGGDAPWNLDIGPVKGEVFNIEGPVATTFSDNGRGRERQDRQNPDPEEEQVPLGEEVGVASSLRRIVRGFLKKVIGR